MGYIELALLHEAAAELDAVAFEDRFTAEVMAARVELHMAEKKWESVIDYASLLTSKNPADVNGWTAWAYALRELNRIEEARDVLLEAESLHGAEESLIEYNLACYLCLLGDLAGAKARLKKACRMNSENRESALVDTDLKPLWNYVAALK
jgi:Flp pilus assembly protein TadD